MAKHMRTQIREAVVAALKGLPTTGQNVFPARDTPVDDSKLPAILVYSRSERSVNGAMGSDSGRPVNRTLDLWIVGACRVAGTPPDDVLDQICAEVEPVIVGDATLAGIFAAAGLELISTDFDVPSDAKDKRAGRVGMTWRGTYRTAAGDPTASV